MVRLAASASAKRFLRYGSQDDPMILYHFTSRHAYSSIIRTGLVRGSVPLGPQQDLNAVWLTSDPGPSGHGLEAGGAFMTEAQRQQAFEWSGVLPPEGARFPKEAAVRITVEIADDDANLHRWLAWARRKLPAAVMNMLHPVGDSMQQARSWFIYTGIIPPSAIVAAEQMPQVEAVRRADALT